MDNVNSVQKVALAVLIFAIIGAFYLNTLMWSSPFFIVGTIFVICLCIINLKSSKIQSITHVFFISLMLLYVIVALPDRDTLQAPIIWKVYFSLTLTVVALISYFIFMKPRTDN